MDSKLTVKLEKGIIEKAKAYARLQKISLSKLIENYLRWITNKPAESEEITPLVKSLSGSIQLPKGYNHKKSYGTYLVAKYSK
jgi:hypothetical protein